MSAPKLLWCTMPLFWGSIGVGMWASANETTQICCFAEAALRLFEFRQVSRSANRPALGVDRKS
jgi:hypothetical protein